MTNPETDLKTISLSVKIGYLEVDLTDSVISRVIETLVTDFPQLAAVAPIDDPSANIIAEPKS